MYSAQEGPLDSLGTAPAQSHEIDIQENRPGSTDIGEMSALSKVWLLWRERRFLVRWAVIGAVLGACIAFLLPKSYESTTQLMPPDSDSNSNLSLLASLTGRGTPGLTGLAGGFLGLKSSGALFTGILSSRSVQDDIIASFDLKKVYGTRLDKVARQTLSNRTLISEDRKSGIITITVTDHDPIRATAIANAYVFELDRTVSRLSTSSAHRERVFLEQRLAAVKQQLDEASIELSQFQSKNGTIDINEEGRTMITAAASLMGELVAAQSQLKGLEQIYAPDNVRVRSVQARIAELQKQLDKIGGTDSSGTSSSLGTATSPGTTSSAGTVTSPNSKSVYPSIRELPVLGVRYADLYRRAKIQEAVYETLTQEYELAKVQEAKETPSVKVLDSAMVPEMKSFPPHALITALFALLFVFGAAVSLIAQAVWIETDPADPRKLFLQTVASDLSSTVRPVWSRIRRKTDSYRSRQEDDSATE